MEKKNYNNYMAMFSKGIEKLWYEKAYIEFVAVVLDGYDFEKETYGDSIYNLPAWDDVDYWRMVIIDHHNHMKCICQKTGNPLGQFNFYKNAQDDLNTYAKMLADCSCKEMFW